MIDTAYDKVVNELKEVASGRRGWVSLTKSARACGVPKEQLRVVALALGLAVSNHGRHGMSASKKRPDEPGACDAGRAGETPAKSPGRDRRPGSSPRRTDASYSEARRGK